MNGNGVTSPQAANEHVHNIARRYCQASGLAPVRERARMTPDSERMQALANAYDEARSNTEEPATREAYAYFRGEVLAQFDALTLAGYTFDAWTQPGQPYANSAEMTADVRDNKHLWYFRTVDGNPTHDLLPAYYNDLFRCVHDVFGHAQFGNQFGPKGELNAYLDHVQMFSNEARPALTTETLAQNAWFNFSKANEGKSVNERAFAEQKATLLDPALYEQILVDAEALDILHDLSEEVSA